MQHWLVLVHSYNILIDFSKSRGVAEHDVSSTKRQQYVMISHLNLSHLAGQLSRSVPWRQRGKFPEVGLAAFARFGIPETNYNRVLRRQGGGGAGYTQ